MWRGECSHVVGTPHPPQRCGARNRETRPRPRRRGSDCGACPVWVDPRRHGARWHGVSRRVEGHAEPLCPGLQTLPLRAAFAPTGAFGSACFVVSARRSARVFPSPAAQLSPSRARLLDPSFRSCERPTDTGPANQLVRMSALYSARKPAIPSVGNTAHVRNRRPTCGTGGPRAEQEDPAHRVRAGTAARHRPSPCHPLSHERVAHDGRLAARAHTDGLDAAARQLFQALDVVLGGLRQLIEGTAL